MDQEQRWGTEQQICNPSLATDIVNEARQAVWVRFLRFTLYGPVVYGCPVQLQVPAVISKSIRKRCTVHSIL